MTTTMDALSSASIRHTEFVRLTTASVTLNFCSAGGSITVGGITFTGVYQLLNVSDIPQDIKSTSDDVSISLTGLDPADIVYVLGADVKGSKVEIWRGFLDSNNQVITTPTTQFFRRYTGFVNSVSINEDFDEQNRMRIATITLACTSFRRILETRIASLRTNQKSWQFFYPSDTSMNRVAQISNQYFDFGKPPQTGSVSDPDTGVGSTYTPIESAGA